MFSIGRTHQGSQEMTLIRLVRKLAEHVTPFPDVQAEGEMAPDNLYRMTVQLIKVCALSTLQRLCSSLLCSCSYWKVCLLAVNTRVSWSHFQLVLNALLPYVAQCCKSVQTTTRQNCSAPSHPPPPPFPPRTVVKQALSAGAVPVHNSMYSLTSSELTACLMQANAVKLDALWVHMSPDDATLKNLQTAAQISAVQNLQARNNLNKDISQVW